MYFDRDLAKRWEMKSPPYLGGIDFDNPDSREFYIPSANYQNILDLIRRSFRMRGDSALGIFGSPGSGKSTLLRAIESELDEAIYFSLSQNVFGLYGDELEHQTLLDFTSFLIQSLSGLGILPGSSVNQINAANEEILKSSYLDIQSFGSLVSSKFRYFLMDLEIEVDPTNEKKLILLLDDLNYVHENDFRFFLNPIGLIARHIPNLSVVFSCDLGAKHLFLEQKHRGIDTDIFDIFQFQAPKSSEIVLDRFKRARKNRALTPPIFDNSASTFFDSTGNNFFNFEIIENLLNNSENKYKKKSISSTDLEKIQSIYGPKTPNINKRLIFSSNLRYSRSEMKENIDLQHNWEKYADLDDRINATEFVSTKSLAEELKKFLETTDNIASLHLTEIEQFLLTTQSLREAKSKFDAHLISTNALHHNMLANRLETK
jgi:energy-coupling factor transporter ATP-binding protein EcfA2